MTGVSENVSEIHELLLFNGTVIAAAGRLVLVFRLFCVQRIWVQCSYAFCGQIQTSGDSNNLCSPTNLSMLCQEVALLDVLLSLNWSLLDTTHLSIALYVGCNCRRCVSYLCIMFMGGASFCIVLFGLTDFNGFYVLCSCSFFIGTLVWSCFVWLFFWWVACFVFLLCRFVKMCDFLLWFDFFVVLWIPCLLISIFFFFTSFPLCCECLL